MFFLWLSKSFAICSHGFLMVSHGSLIFHCCRMVFLWFFPWFSIGFRIVFPCCPLVFQWFSHGLPMFFFSLGFPMVVPYFCLEGFHHVLCSHGFQMVFLCISRVFPWFAMVFPLLCFHWVINGLLMFSHGLCFSHGCPMAFQWGFQCSSHACRMVSNGFPMLFILFPMVFLCVP